MTELVILFGSLYFVTSDELTKIDLFVSVTKSNARPSGVLVQMQCSKVINHQSVNHKICRVPHHIHAISTFFSALFVVVSEAADSNNEMICKLCFSYSIS